MAALVLHHEHDRLVHCHDHYALPTDQTYRIPLGQNHGGWTTGLRLHACWSQYGL